MEKSKERLEIIEKINTFEKEKKFNEDVENDPAVFPIKPNEVDYLNKKLSSKILTKLANFLGTMYF